MIDGGGRERRTLLAGALLALVGLGVSTSATAQELADYDYENLAFRGVGAEVGFIWPSRVEPTTTLGVRMDLGYLGPGLRIVPGITYWSSRMKPRSVRELEERVEELLERQGGPPVPVNLGTVDWADLVLSLDGHVVWRLPSGLLTFGGVGTAAHILNGGGEIIDGTFVEDLLDGVRAGANLHAGLEYPVGRGRLYTLTRFEVLGDFQYLELRFGGQLMFGASAPGEARE